MTRQPATARCITVRYFASVREAMGTSEEVVQTAAQTLGDLRAELQARSTVAAQALAPERAVRMALNQEIAESQALLSEGCEVAFFPPVTGG